jgi:hypothetical protein
VSFVADYFMHRGEVAPGHEDLRENRGIASRVLNLATKWEIKMNRRAFVSINRMRAGHFSLKASLSRFNVVCMRTKGQQ